MAWEHIILWLLEQYYRRASCFEREFDDSAGGRLLNLEFEMLGHYETTYFKQLWDPLKLWISSRNKIPCRFQCSSVLRGFENRPPAVLHTWTLALQKYPIPTALFLKIYLLNHNSFWISIQEIIQLMLAVPHLENNKFTSAFQLMFIMDKNGFSFPISIMFDKHLGTRKKTCSYGTLLRLIFTVNIFFRILLGLDNQQNSKPNSDLKYLLLSIVEINPSWPISSYQYVAYPKLAQDVQLHNPLTQYRKYPQEHRWNVVVVVKM